MHEFLLDNGWVVSKKEDQPAILHVKPLEGSLFRKEQFVEIPDHIFREIESGERSIKELFRNYKLHNLIFQWDSRQPVIAPPHQNTDNAVYGRGFMATKEKGYYYLTYELSRHGGGNRKIPITKKIFEDARTTPYSTSEIFKRYNLYHLDIPENDVN